jgi:hypothetical protein
MGKYGEVAVVATALVQQGSCASPIESWHIASLQAFPDRPESQKKGCPKGAFLGLCEDGLVVGIPRGSYTKSRDNKAYAVAAVDLLRREPTLVMQGPAHLWERIMRGRQKTSNSQMEVVLALWTAGLIVRKSPP